MTVAEIGGSSRKPVAQVMLLIAAIATGLVPGAESRADELMVGASRIDISGPDYANRPDIPEYDHERLYLRAIVIDNGETRAALIGADLGGIQEDVWQDTAELLSNEFDIPVANIVLSSTHTHSDTAASRTPGRSTGRYGSDFIAEVSRQAVREALSKLEPAKVGFAEGEAHLNVNRDAISPSTNLWTQAANLDGPSDKTVATLSFVRPGGDPIAVYVNYAMHPVAGYLSGVRSADVPGAMSRHVERSFGDTMVAVFTQGPSGDQNPRWLRPGTNAMASRGDLDISGYEMVREDVEAPIREQSVDVHTATPFAARQLADFQQALGVVLGEEVIRTMTYTDFSDGAPEIWGKQTNLTCPGRRRLNSGREGMAGVYEDGDDVVLRLGLLAIGDIAIGTTNAEVYSPIGQQLKKKSAMTKTLYVTLANGRGNSGYVPDDASFGHQTFQVLGSRLKPGCAEDGIVDGISGLVDEYLAR